MRENNKLVVATKRTNDFIASACVSAIKHFNYDNYGPVSGSRDWGLDGGGERGLSHHKFCRTPSDTASVSERSAHADGFPIEVCLYELSFVSSNHLNITSPYRSDEVYRRTNLNGDLLLAAFQKYIIGVIVWYII